MYYYIAHNNEELLKYSSSLKKLEWQDFLTDKKQSMLEDNQCVCIKY